MIGKKIIASPSFLLGVICFALVLLQGLGEQCHPQCNSTSTYCGSGCVVTRRRPPTPPRRPPPPPRRPPPPPRRPPPPALRPPPPHPPPPPTLRPPPPAPRPPPPRPPPPPTLRPPPPAPRPPPPTPRSPPPPTPRPPPPPPPPTPEGPTFPEDLTDIFTEELFNEFITDLMSPCCPGRWFYTYDAFIAAAKDFPEFANTGDEETRKREIAAFLGQTSHETAGTSGYWGYCYIEEEGAGASIPYCKPSAEWPCIPGSLYYGRGPVQLTWNTNYGKAGEALGLNLLFSPELVAQDPVVSFETAIWFWMTRKEPNMPSPHEVITGQWEPSPADEAANRFPGYGVITNIFNGASECGIYGPDFRVENRIQFYKTYCDMLGVSYGDNLDCYDQFPFTWYLNKIDQATESSRSSS